MEQENHSNIIPAGIGNTIYFCRVDNPLDIKGSVNLDTGEWHDGPTELSFELKAKDVKKGLMLKLNPTRLPRKEKKRRKVRGCITSAGFGMANDIDYVFLFHKQTMVVGLPLLSAKHKAKWQRIAAWLNANSKRSLDLNKSFRF